MRYLPITDDERTEMMQDIGVNHINELFPDFISDSQDFDLPNHQGELEISLYLDEVSNKNVIHANKPFFLGGGCYRHHIPVTVDYIIQRSEFLTSYTPYQPEISQGTLTYLFEFQTMVARLTGMDIANASIYDGATSLVEAVLMAKRITKHSNVVIKEYLNPHYRQVLDTYLENYDDIKLSEEAVDQQTACVIVSYPDYHGNIPDLEVVRKECDAIGALMIVVVTEIIALGLLPAPEMADIVVGEGQSLGNNMNFGGPHLGLFAAKKQYVRQMPGRLCGQTVDADGKTSYVLTLNTREQHIRREKATSNICTNQGLCVLAFTVHLSLLGEDGFKQLARINHEKACVFVDKLEKLQAVKVSNTYFFNEFVIELPYSSETIVKAFDDYDIIPGITIDSNKLLLCVTELTTENDMDKFVAALQEIIDFLSSEVSCGIGK